MSTPAQIAANQANGIGDREPGKLPFFMITENIDGRNLSCKIFR